MRFISLAFLIIFFGFQASAQERGQALGAQGNHKYYKHNNSARCPVFYLTISTGINNNTGLLSVSFEKPIAKSFSLEGGLGISSWGYKFYGGGKYYFRSCQRGWAVGTGVTYNTGIRNYQSNAATIYGTTETVVLNLNPQANALLAVYRFWNLGKRSNRVYFELGWSQPFLGGSRFDQIYGDPMSKDASDLMNRLSPGGLIVGVGFSFGKF